MALIAPSTMVANPPAAESQEVGDQAAEPQEVGDQAPEPSGGYRTIA